MDEYAEFLARKTVASPAVGFSPDVSTFPPAMKAFQRDIVTWACRRGRAAVFAGTGLGKTLQQLAWARQVCDQTGGRVLILAPLAVAFQTVDEAKKFGVASVAYVADEDAIGTDIVVTNYDRRHLFDLSQFAGIVLDESSILKSQDGKTRAELMEAADGILYKLCCSATPAPNDWTELGQHAEFLGVMSAKEMLAMFFVHEGSVRAAPGIDEWRLKRHAERDFWRWVSTWAVMMQSPSDLGYDEPGYVLPPIHYHQITVPADYAPQECGMLFPMEARTMAERRSVKRSTIARRVAAAAQIINAHPDRPWLVWCDLNAEGEAITSALADALEVAGSHSIEVKTDRLLGFCRGAPRVLVTKPKVASFGMNWQHCADMVFVGLNDSFEQLFQAVRRCWRFGQTNPVNVYLIASELEGAVVANLREKERKYDQMAQSMVEHMRGFSGADIRGGRVSTTTYEPTLTMELPSWMAA